MALTPCAGSCCVPARLGCLANRRHAISGYRAQGAADLLDTAAFLRFMRVPARGHLMQLIQFAIGHY